MTKPTRIVFLYGYMWSEREAVAKAIHELAAALCHENDADIELRGIEKQRIVEASSSMSTKLRRLASETRFALSALAYTLRHRSRIQAIVSIDIPSGIGYVGSLARRATKGRIVDIAWVMDLYRAGNVPPSIRGRLEISALRSAGKVITIGSCMSRLLLERFEVRSGVIPLWHESLDLISEHAESLPTPTKPLRVLYSGSARAIHPLDALVRATDEMRRTTTLDLVGSGTEMVASQVTAEKLHSPNVRIRSRLANEEFAKAVSEADVHVVSLDEAATGTCVPSKAYAAMAAGKPILYLGSEDGQAARDIAEAQCGFVVATTDKGGIVAALQRYADSPELRRVHGVNAARFHAKRRTVRAAVPLWLEELS